MKLQQISTFVVVYQERSFTAAAERVHATQSGLSMQVKELEEGLGLQLFVRTTRGVEPTAAGERFHGYALRLLRELDAARVGMRSMRGQETGAVTAGLMPTFSRAALSPAVAEYTAAYPYVNLKVVEAYSAVLTDGVRREELDLAIVPPVAADPRLHSSFVSRDREMFVTSARSRRPHLATVSMAEVGPLRLILPSRGNARRARLDDYLKGIGVAVEAVLEMDAMMGTLELIATSDWVSILPATLCFPDIARGPRRVHPIVDPTLTVDYVLVTPAARAVSPAAAAFAEVLSRHIRLIGIAWDQRLRHQKN